MLDIELERTLRLLEKRALQLQSRIEDFQRPLVIEFTGTPKSGKTTCVDAISKFFRRNGIPVHIVAERASVCPVSDKKSLFFNVWTSAMSLAQMIAAFETGARIVILDRGVFDSLAWMRFHLQQKNITETEFKSIEQFLLLEKFVARVSIVAALSVSPPIALEREFKDQITDKTGSIMNKETLNAYNEGLQTCLARYVDHFRRFITLNTTSMRPVVGVQTIAKALLDAADEILDEKIAVVPRDLVERIFGGAGSIAEPSKITEAMKTMLENLRWRKRSSAEEDVGVVQLVPVGVVYRDSEVLLITSRGTKHGRLAEKRAVWLGGHCRISDLPPRAKRATLFRRTLRREVDEEIRLSVDIGEIPRVPKAMIWDNSQPRSAQHLGIFHPLENPAARHLLHEREFPEIVGKSVFTKFVPCDSTIAENEELEQWSVEYLRAIHEIEAGSEGLQRYIF